MRKRNWRWLALGLLLAAAGDGFGQTPENGTEADAPPAEAAPVQAEEASPEAAPEPAPETVPNPSVEAQPATEEPKVDGPGEYDSSAPAGIHHQRIPGQTPGAPDVVLLENNLNYLDEAGQLQASDLRIVPTPEGAELTRTWMKVRFAADLNTAGAIDMRTPKGTHLRAIPIGLSYYDANSGQSVLLCELKSSLGRIVEPSKVVYEDIFDDVDADAVYEATKQGIMQTIIIKEDLPPPSAFGLSDETSRLEVVTEFPDAPQPEKAAKVLKAEEDPVKRQNMVSPDFSDTSLKFADSQIADGMAFGVNLEEADAIVKSQPVGKHWQEMPGEGRSILFESIEYSAAKAEFGKLPKKEAQTPKPQATLGRSLPAKRLASTARKPLQVAAAEYRPRGMAIDWELKDLDLTSFTFLAGKTYVISGPYTQTNSTVTIGTAVFQGGAIIKYHEGRSLKVTYTATFSSTGANPVIFTAFDDDTYGEIIPAANYFPASDGMPAMPTAVRALDLPTYNGATVSYAKFHYAGVAVYFSATGYYPHGGVNNSTFSNYGYGIVNNFGSGTPSLSFSSLVFCTNGSGTNIHTIYPASSSVSGNMNNCNALPTLASIGNLTVAEDASPVIVPLTGITAGGESQALGVSATFSNLTNNPVASATSSYTSANSTGSISLALGANQNGSALVWVVVRDAGGNGVLNTVDDGFFTRQFKLTVTPVNDPPTVTTLANLTIDQDSSTGPLNFTIGDIDTALGNLTVTGVSLNTPLVPNGSGNITFQGSGTNRSVTITPLAGQSGSAWITVSVNDGAGGSASTSFLLTVRPKAAAPAFNTAFSADHSSVTVTASGPANSFVRYTMADPPSSPSDPTSSDSILSALNLAAPKVIKARTFLAGYADSDVATLNLNQTASMTFSHNGHDYAQYASGPLALQLTAEAGALIYYKVGAAGSWVTNQPNGINLTLDGIDQGNGPVTAYAFTADKLKNATIAKNYSFRAPQPLSSAAYSAGSATLTFNNLLANATLELFLNGATSNPEIKTANASGVVTRSGFGAPTTLVRAKHRKSGYVDSGFTTAHANQLPAAQIATTGGVLTSNLTVSAPIDIWLLPNFGFNNLYGEINSLSGWEAFPSNTSVTWSPETPDTNYLGSFVNTGLNTSLISLGRVRASYGRDYSMRGYFKGLTANTNFAGVSNFDDSLAELTCEDFGHTNYPVVTYLTQPLASGSTTVYVANEQIFLPISTNLHQNLFVPLSNVSQNGPMLRDNQPQAVASLYQPIPYYNQSSSVRVIGVSTSLHTLTLNLPYTGTNLPAGTLIARRSSGDTYQYSFLHGQQVPVNSWTLYTKTSSYLRPGTDRVAVLAILSLNGGQTLVSGLEWWEGGLSDRPNLHYSINGNAAVYSLTGTPGPIKIRLTGNTPGGNNCVITVGQRGSQYFDAPVEQRIITFAVSPFGASVAPLITGQRTITLTNIMGGSSVRYTLDGTEPAISSSNYTGPVTVSREQTFKAKGFLAGYNDTPTFIDLGAPTYSPGGNINQALPQGVTLTAAPPSGTQLRRFELGPNLMSSENWVLNQSTQTGYGAQGQANENTVEHRATPYRTLDKVWVARSLDTDIDADGGWNADSVSGIDTNRTYRFSVWVRKANSSSAAASGKVYFGAATSSLVDAAGVPAADGYFIGTDLPTNQWHLLVGFVHPSTYNGPMNYSKVYNASGQPASVTPFTQTDLKWSPYVQASYHKVYFYSCTQIGGELEIWNPRMEIVNAPTDPPDILTTTTLASPSTFAFQISGARALQAQSYSSSSLMSAVATEKYTVLVDSDSDGLPDAWELSNFGNLSQNSAGDPDTDGLSNADEQEIGTNPNLQQGTQAVARLNYTYDLAGRLWIVTGTRGETNVVDSENSVIEAR